MAVKIRGSIPTGFEQSSVLYFSLLFPQAADNVATWSFEIGNKSFEMKDDSTSNQARDVLDRIKDYLAISQAELPKKIFKLKLKDADEITLALNSQISFTNGVASLQQVQAAAAGVTAAAPMMQAIKSGFFIVGLYNFVQIKPILITAGLTEDQLAQIQGALVALSLKYGEKQELISSIIA